VRWYCPRLICTKFITRSLAVFTVMLQLIVTSDTSSVGIRVKEFEIVNAASWYTPGVIRIRSPSTDALTAEVISAKSVVPLPTDSDGSTTKSVPHNNMGDKAIEIESRQDRYMVIIFTNIHIISEKLSITI